MFGYFAKAISYISRPLLNSRILTVLGMTGIAATIFFSYSSRNSDDENSEQIEQFSNDIFHLARQSPTLVDIQEHIQQHIQQHIQEIEQGNSTYIFNIENLYVSMKQPTIIVDDMPIFDGVEDADDLIERLSSYAIFLANTVREPLAIAAKETYGAYFKNLFRSIVYGVADNTTTLLSTIGLGWLGKTVFTPGQQLIELRKWLFSTSSDVPAPRAKECNPNYISDSRINALAEKLSTLKDAETNIFASGNSVVIENKEFSEFYQEFLRRKLMNIQQAAAEQSAANDDALSKKPLKRLESSSLRNPS